MSESAAVANVKKLILVGADLGTAIGGILADGKVGLSDLRYGIQIVSAVKGLVELDYKSLGLEFKDMDSAEKESLDKAFRERFDIKADGIEAGIEEGFSLLLTALKGVLSLTELKDKLKKVA